MVENEVLRKILGTVQRQVKQQGVGKKFRIGEAHNFYSTLNNINVIESEIVRGAGSVAHMGQVRTW
jgi:hypothetical protein